MLEKTPSHRASLTRISATTLAGGAGNDIIGGFTNVNNQWAAVNISADVLKTDIEGVLVMTPFN